MASVTVSGADAAIAALRKIAPAVARQMASAVEDEAEQVVSDAQSNVRADSGDLRDSIAAETSTSGMSATIRPRSYLSDDPEVKHAIKAAVNEFGRASDDGQPYMVPAAERSRARWPKRAQEAVERGTKG